MAGVTPVPISEIRHYCDLFKIHNVDMRETLTDRIQYLDTVYREHVEKKAEEGKTKKR